MLGKSLVPPMHRSLVMLLSLVIAAGCESKPKDEAGASPKTEPSNADARSGRAPACDQAWGNTLRRELEAECSISDQVLPIEVPLAPWKAAPSSPPSSELRMEVTQRGVVVSWGEPVPLAALADRFAERRDAAARMAEALGENGPTWVLAVAPDVPRAELATVLGVLVDAKQLEGHVLLATTQVGELPHPRNPAVLARLAAKLEGADPSMKATILAQEIQRRMPACPPIEKTFAAVASAAPESRCPLLAAGISEGLVSCGCPEADELLTQMYVLTVGTKQPERLSVAVKVTLDPTAPSRPGDTWAAVVDGAEPATFDALWIAPD